MKAGEFSKKNVKKKVLEYTTEVVWDVNELNNLLPGIVMGTTL